MEKEIIEVKIVLNETNPPIWRRLLIPATITFFDLHHIFQIGMGWTNSHLFEFKVGDYTIGYIDDQFEESEGIADANEVTLETLLMKEGTQFSYLYDFGDHWQHTVIVEKLLKKEEGKIYPICREGSLRSPPEDCGSIPGFYNLLEILKDKKHPEYKETKTWLGRGYDPEKFDLEKVNKELPKFKKYMKHWR
jgi:hypothetical protein